MLYCSCCKEQIISPRYKYLHINNIKTDIVICVECHMMKYFLKPFQFKKDYPIKYNNELKRIAGSATRIKQDLH